MTEEIEMHEQQAATEGEGSGSLALPPANNSSLRRRSVPLMGYSVPAPDPSPYSPEGWTNIQRIATILVALNVTTLRALRNGWFESSNFSSRCQEYEGVLGERQAELIWWIMDNGVHFEAHVREYVNGKNHKEITKCLLDTRASLFYSQLVDIEIKNYRSAQIYSALALKADEQKIPRCYEYLESYQSYVELVVADEQERRVILKSAIERARALRVAIKVAADNGDLDDKVLEVLKLKLLALQEHFDDATTLLFGKSSNLFDPERVDWWNYGVPQTPSRQESSPSTPARAYETSSRKSMSALSFFVPTICLLSCIPMALAWTHSPWEVGTTEDANFYQLLAGSLVQLLSLVTLIWPTLFHATFSGPGHSWIWAWILAVSSGLCTIISMPLYFLVPSAWSMTVSFAGMIMQALIVLQIVNAI